MKNPKINQIFRLFDFLLSPFMWILGGFVFPIQETHAWHVKKWNWNYNKGVVVNQTDKKSKFGHDSPLGLFHMPIFGGLTKYVIIEAIGYNDYWYVGWENAIQCLKIKQNRITLLVAKKKFTAYGLGDNGKILKLKIVSYGQLGDNKFKGLRLF